MELTDDGTERAILLIDSMTVDDVVGQEWATDRYAAALEEVIHAMADGYSSTPTTRGAAVSRKLDGTAAATKAARRKQAAFGEMLNTAVEKGYFAENPLNGLRWKAPAVDEEVNPAAVPNPAQVVRLLAAVAQQRGRGPHLEAFFGCMYYVAMRSAEVIHLRLEQRQLPEPRTRAPRDHRHPACAHPAAAYASSGLTYVTWARARKYVLTRYVLTRTELASGLAKRPYDLRHAGISFWLYSGVDPAEWLAVRARASRSSFATTPSSWTASESRPTASSSSR